MIKFKVESFEDVEDVLDLLFFVDNESMMPEVEVVIPKDKLTTEMYDRLNSFTGSCPIGSIFSSCDYKLFDKEYCFSTNNGVQL